MINRYLLTSLIAIFISSKSLALDVYGKANVTINDTEDNIELNSNASRIGFKGSADLGGGLQAIYKFEYETFVDDGDKSGNTFSQRNISAGFKGGFGSIIAGKHDSPTKLAQGKVDLFNDLPNADIKNLIQGENRVSNIIIYTTPSMNGIKASFAYIPDEDETVDNNGTSSSIQFKADNLTLTVAHDDGLAIDSSVESLTRYVAEYKMGNMKLGAIFQTADEGPTEEDGQILSASMKMSDTITLKAQIGESDDESTETTQTAFGIDYKLGKKSKLFAYYSDIEKEGSTDSEVSTIGAGYEIKF